jgi:[CysO sulfur-carrier protein]-S-L-cysteine hydrolase
MTHNPHAAASPTPWVNGGVRLTGSTLGRIEQAALNAYARQEEACGFLSGPATDPLLCDSATELENLANKYHKADPEGHPRTGRDYFKIHSLKFERAIAQGEQQGQPVKVFFHSHLDCGAYFSEEDADSMTNGGSGSPAYAIAYWVTAVDRGVVSAHRLFVWDEATQRFCEAPFSVVEDRAVDDLSR